MNPLSFITWDVSPEIFSIGPLSIRYYGLLFALGFIIGQNIMVWFFKLEGRSLAHIETLLVWMVASIVIGARLGHCLFYEPEYYLKQPWKILFVWEGGLASHGATIAMLIGMYLFVRKYTEYSWLYLLDRLSVTVALGAGFIRLGNLMNSEIVGKATNVPWGFVFRRNLTPEGFPELFARHPSQLYEAFFYFVVFVFLLFTYWSYKAKLPNGRIIGYLMVLVFVQRILIEFTKENQVDFESALPLNMGQLLSIPMVILGAIILYRSFTKPLKW